MKHLLLFLSLSVAFAEEPLKTETRPLPDFKKEILPKSADATVEGSAVRMKFNPPAAYPAVVFKLDPPADFRGYGGLAFDAYNPNDSTVAFAVRMDSSTEADGNGNNSRTGRGSIDGKQRVTFVLPFGVDPASLKMKALPGFGEMRSLGTLGSGPFDLGHIVNWQVFLARPQDVQELVIENVRLVPGKKQDFNQIIDSYGQYSREDWPGKIKTDADFAAQIAAEDQDLSAHKEVPGRDQYGGWSEGPKLEATGFFRTAKYKDKWAFVDPEGRLFLSFGPTGIGAGDATPIKDREYMFTDAPKTDEVNFFAANLQRKYGADYKNLWYARTYDRLRSWGFNTIAAFSSWDVIGNGKVPYTATVWPGGKHARVSWGKDHVRAMDDPFDPQFAADVAGALKAQVAKTKDDPYCIGYFVGNEEAWGHFKHEPRNHYGLALGALKADASSPAKQAFLTQLQAKYGDIAKLNAAWKTTFADWAALNAPVTVPDPLGDAMLADFSAFLKLHAETYFRTVSEEIKKADPNHLYLGCRFAGYSPEVLEAAAKYADVLSFNVYRLKLNPAEWDILKGYDKPVVIGEFHFGATDRGVFDTGLIAASDQKGRGAAYGTYIQSVLDHPNFVGAHWFQYIDQPATGRTMDGENAGIGFITITDTPYPELIDAARRNNSGIYQYRFGK